MHLSVGGPMRKISVGGKIFDFEMHPYCGPTLLDNRGHPKDIQKHPKDFLHAASQWSSQGQKIEDGLCVWFHEPEDILKHMGGRHWLLIGQKPAVRGF